MDSVSSLPSSSQNVPPWEDTNSWRQTLCLGRQGSAGLLHPRLDFHPLISLVDISINNDIFFVESNFLGSFGAINDCIFCTCHMK